MSTKKTLTTLINILKKDTYQTFDLTDFTISWVDKENRIIFCKSNQVFTFDKCIGEIVNRSRVLRESKDESDYVENVIGAVADAGFTGHLEFKIKLTVYGSDFISTYLPNKDSNLKELQNSVSIKLTQSPHNYYKGTNQTVLIPDVVFFADETNGDSEMDSTEVVL